MKMKITALVISCILFLIFLNCSRAQDLIEISADIKLRQVGQELIGTESDAEFGRRVAINELGNRIVVASREADQAFVYQLEDGQWVQLGQTLECDYCRWFGFEVDISDDGETVAIGSESEGIYIFQYEKENWVLKGDALLPEKYSYGVGRTLELSGDGNLIAFTAYAAESDKRIIEAGAVYVLEFKNNSWVQKGNVLYGDLAGQQMGYDMSFSRNGDRLVVSSPYHGYRYTKAFQLKDNLWKQLGKGINPKEKKDGRRVRMNDPGDQILSYNGSGKIYLHQLIDGNWEEIDFQGEHKKHLHDYGYGFEFTPFSSLVLISNPTAETGSSNLGEIFFFDLEKKDEPGPIASLKGKDDKNYFGYDMHFSSNGKMLVIGSMGLDGEGLGSVKVFELIKE